MGVLEIDGYNEQIAEIKKLYRYLRVAAHAGFVDNEMAGKLRKSGCDAVLLNIIGNSAVIEKCV